MIPEGEAPDVMHGATPELSPRAAVGGVAGLGRGAHVASALVV